MLDMAKKRDEVDKACLERLFNALNVVRGVSEDATVSQVMALLHIAIHPDTTQTELLTHLSMRSSGQSALISRLAGGDQRSNGLNLVGARENPLDRRQKLLDLTIRGDAVVDSIVALLKGGPTQH